MFKNVRVSAHLTALKRSSEGDLSEDKKQQILPLLDKLSQEIEEDKKSLLSFEYNDCLNTALSKINNTILEVPSGSCKKNVFYSTDRGEVYIEDVTPKDSTIDVITVSLESKNG